MLKAFAHCVAQQGGGHNSAFNVEPATREMFIPENSMILERHELSLDSRPQSMAQKVSPRYSHATQPHLTRDDSALKAEVRIQRMASPRPLSLPALKLGH